MKKLAPVLFALLLLTGCSSIFSSSRTVTSDSGYGYGGAMQQESFSSTAAPEAFVSDKSTLSADSSSYDASVTDRKLIKTGDLSLHVQDVRASVTSITGVVTEKAGMVISSNVTRGDTSYSGYMEVRVPADKFEDAMTALKALAIYVESENSNSSDVTEYYMDLETRLTNKQAEEAQYLEIMKQADNVTDTLAVTQALNDVQYEIESLQAQIKGYDTQIDYSSIYINLSEDESAAATSETWSPESTYHQAESDFISAIQGVVDLLIYVGIFGWPVLVLVVLVLVIRRRGRKGGKK